VRVAAPLYGTDPLPCSLQHRLHEQERILKLRPTIERRKAGVSTPPYVTNCREERGSEPYCARDKSLHPPASERGSKPLLSGAPN
jgi:hypothetical protein